MENENNVRVEESAEKQPKKPLSKLAKWIIAALIVVIGVGGVLAGILVPLKLGSREFTDEEGVNPKATIKLSNGMQLDFDIYENECPNGATNFIWLASIGYFDNVILFDSQQGFVRFGGWTDAKNEDGTPMHRGDDDTSFTDKIKLSEWTDTGNKTKNFDKNKFGYRLKSDSAKSNTVNTIGTLSFCYERSATEFTLTAKENPVLTVPNDNGGSSGSKQEWKVSPFGFASNPQTIDNIKAIEALDRDDGTKFNHDYFRAPLDENGLIKIKSVKVTGKYSGKWKSFDMVRYINTNNGEHRSSWTESKKRTGN